MTGVFEGRQPLWQLARRRLIVRGGGLLIERFVRAVVVVFLTESIKADLLTAKRVTRGTRGFGLERAVHAFMAPVLLR